MFSDCISFSVDKEKLTHDDLVNLLSTALTGNSILGVDYDDDAYDALPEEYKETFIDGHPCVEDKCASLLRSGGSIVIVDMESAEEIKMRFIKDAYLFVYDEPVEKAFKRLEYIEESPCEHVDCDWEQGYCYCGYRVTLKDIERALSDKRVAHSVQNFVEENEDLYDGSNIIQVAAFGDIIYG